ncbi:hypothetical protein MXMO3_01987 [Maritalea myrionectae]|uniref:Uncharacterized protein n=1 Tax=Maritalea myrionectae TaxID=454601 RepID=A0A2R4MEN6_9HYPH|nr:hypothetical protein MXMO3_01987 [Maritalea myrionectae]
MKTNEKAKITRGFTPLAYEIVALLCHLGGICIVGRRIEN